mgnify:CR=1 FL=1
MAGMTWRQRRSVCMTSTCLSCHRLIIPSDSDSRLCIQGQSGTTCAAMSQNRFVDRGANRIHETAVTEKYPVCFTVSTTNATRCRVCWLHCSAIGSQCKQVRANENTFLAGHRLCRSAIKTHFPRRTAVSTTA